MRTMATPTPATEARLRQLVDDTEDHGEGAPRREIARATHGLPVYADMSGGLAVTPEGRVLHYSWETREVREADEKWTRLARVRLVREHPEFRELLPARTANAKTCAACGGSGLLHSMDCGDCFGAGWVD